MANMDQEFADGVCMLQTVQAAMKDAGQCISHDGATQPSDVSEVYETEQETETTQEVWKATQDDFSATQGVNPEVPPPRGVERSGLRSRTKKPRVVYVKLRRREQANVVVLSSEEKYCYAKAAFEPVIEFLAGLTSPAFYPALQSWKEIVRNGMQKLPTYTSDATTMPDDSTDDTAALGDANESDTGSDIDPADLIDTMAMIRDMEQAEHGLLVAGGNVQPPP